jgi:hypothetical protein
MVAAFVRFDGISYSPLAQDRVACVSAARKALGGEDKVVPPQGPHR